MVFKNERYRGHRLRRRQPDEQRHRRQHPGANQYHDPESRLCRHASIPDTRALTTYASSFGIRYLDANCRTTSASALLFVELSLTVQPTAPVGQATQTGGRRAAEH